MLNSHTPIEDVGTVAENCGVKTLILNHLVSAVMPMSHLQRARRGFSGKLIIGKDLMQIQVGRRRGLVWILEGLKPYCLMQKKRRKSGFITSAISKNVPSPRWPWESEV